MSMSGATGKEGLGRGRGRATARGRARSVKQTDSEAGLTKTTTSSTPPASSQRAETQTQISGSTSSTGTSEASRLSKAFREMKVGKPEESELPLALRPDEGGQLGRHMALKANYFPIRFMGQLVVHQYFIEIQHEYRDRKLRRNDLFDIFWATVLQNGEIFQSKWGIVFDGGHQIFSVKALHLPPADQNGKVKLDVEVTLSTDSRASRCCFEIKHIGQHKLELKRERSDTNITSIQVIDMVLRASKTCPYVDQLFVAGGRGFYLPSRTHGGRPGDMDLGLGREIWSGYVSAAHCGRGWKPMLNVDTSHTAFFKQQPVVAFMCEVLSGSSRDPRGGGRSRWSLQSLNNRSRMDQVEMKTFLKEIKGLMVYTTHQKTKEAGRRRGFKVKSISTQPAGQLSFKKTDANGLESNITVDEYFRSINVPLQLPNLPCLQVGSKTRPIYLPLEVCEIAPNQKSNKKLTEDQTSRMIKKACTNASDRQVLTEQMVQDAKLSKDNFASAFGLAVEPRMIELDGRALPPPRIQLSRNGSVDVNNGVWNVSGGNQFYRGARVGQWGLLSFAPQDKQRDLERFCAQLSRSCTALGVAIDEWPESVQYVRTVNDIEPGCRRVMEDIATHCGGHRCGLIVVVMNQRMNDLYAQVKIVGDTLLGVITQVVLVRNVFQPKPATMSNIALKINAKLGGVNNSLMNDAQGILNRFVMNQPTMILGIDVNHPGPIDQRYPSIGSVVGNVDAIPAQFGASITVQKAASKDGLDLKEPIRDRFLQYYKCLHGKPERIIVYRGGISEGEMHKVLVKELTCIRSVCTDLQEDYQPTVTFIVSQKRHHTRFFCRDQRDQCGKAKNIPPGTVVDAAVTNPVNFDFYLCSHYGIQGTSRPTHYYVLHDENNFTSDEIEMITYFLCHIYFRCNRSVSIPAPLYYADLVTQRAKFHLHKLVGSFSDTESVTSAGEDEGPSEQSHSSTELSAAITLRREMINAMYYV